MASVQSDNGWTKTNLGNGWVKLVEVADAFTTGTGDDVKSTAITNTTVAADGGSSMPIINELKAAGEFIIEVTIGATAIQTDTTIHMKDTAGAYSDATGQLIVNQTASTTKLASWNGAITDGLKLVCLKDGTGSGTNTITFSIIYYNGGPNQSDLTISGVGADPS
tara:strand:- start:7157 stop:7651 length:495 start_codon:yes stop_codon:yes gene_type:complete